MSFDREACRRRGASVLAFHDGKVLAFHDGEVRCVPALSPGSGAAVEPRDRPKRRSGRLSSRPESICSASAVCFRHQLGALWSTADTRCKTVAKPHYAGLEAMAAVSRFGLRHRVSRPRTATRFARLCTPRGSSAAVAGYRADSQELAAGRRARRLRSGAATTGILRSNCPRVARAASTHHCWPDRPGSTDLAPHKPAAGYVPRTIVHIGV